MQKLFNLILQMFNIIPRAVLQEYIPTVFETYVSDIEVDNKQVS